MPPGRVFSGFWQQRGRLFFVHMNKEQHKVDPWGSCLSFVAYWVLVVVFAASSYASEPCGALLKSSKNAGPGILLLAPAKARHGERAYDLHTLAQLLDARFNSRYFAISTALLDRYYAQVALELVEPEECQHPYAPYNQWDITRGKGSSDLFLRVPTCDTLDNTLHHFTWKLAQALLEAPFVVGLRASVARHYHGQEAGMRDAIKKLAQHQAELILHLHVLAYRLETMHLSDKSFAAHMPEPPQKGLAARFAGFTHWAWRASQIQLQNNKAALLTFHGAERFKQKLASSIEAHIKREQIYLPIQTTARVLYLSSGLLLGVGAVYETSHMLYNHWPLLYPMLQQALSSQPPQEPSANALVALEPLSEPELKQKIHTQQLDLWRGMAQLEKQLCRTADPNIQKKIERKKNMLMQQYLNSLQKYGPLLEDAEFLAYEQPCRLNW